VTHFRILNYILICLLVCLSCDKKNGLLDKQNQNKNKNKSFNISEKEVQKVDGFFLINNYSDVVYDVNGTMIKIPIFKGKYGEVAYKQLLDYSHENDILVKDANESGYIVKTKNGELKKTLHEFLKFYKSSILSKVDIDKPTKLDLFGDEEKYCDWELYYDFESDGIPFVLKIVVKASKEDFENRANRNKISSVFQLNPDEMMSEPFFYYKFFHSYKTKDLFHR